MNMTPKFFLSLAFTLSGGLFAGEAQTNSQTQQPTNIWEYINYPLATNLSKEPLAFLLSSGEQYDQISRGLRLDIQNIVQGFRFIRTNGIAARLYRANGKICEPTLEGRKSLALPVAAATASYSGEELVPGVITWFPWGSNTLEEAWIEVTIGSERYWLEIPYGFDRNPADPPPPSIPTGPPIFIPPMKLLTGHDHVVRWQSVHYDLGQIQNGWRLSLIQSNSNEAESQVVLYREDVKIGTSTSWKTNSPVTALQVLDANGTITGSHCIDVHIQDGGMERSNEYAIARYGGNL